MRWLLLVLFVLCIQGLVFASPVATCAATDYHFGTLAADHSLEHVFAITNTGDSPLELENARSGCSCTVSIIDKNIIPPGETGQVKVSFTPKGRPGEKTNMVLVDTNDPKLPTMQFSLSCTFEPLSYLSQGTYHFGEALPGNKGNVHANVTLFAGSREQYLTKIKVDMSQAPEFDFELVETVKRKEFEIKFVNKVELPLGFYKGRVRIQGDTEHTFDISGNIRAAIFAQPSFISFDVTRSDTPTFDAEVRILGPDAPGFKVIRASAPEGIQTSISKVNSYYTVSLFGIPKNCEMNTDMIKIETDYPDVPELLIPFRLRPCE